MSVIPTTAGLNKKTLAMQTLNKNLEVKGRSLWKDAFNRLSKNKASVVSIIILFLVSLAVIFAPYLSHYQMEDTDWGSIGLAPNFSTLHFFGTDDLGRDVFARTLYGGRMSLMIGIISSVVSIVIGITYGATAGYIGGKTDDIMMRIVDIIYSLPFMFFVILLMTFFGRNIFLIFVAIGAVNWLDMARIVRGQTLSLKSKEFIEAAHAGGVSSAVIIFRHIVPNILGIVIVYVTLTIPQVILTESFLSFLGLGVQEPATSWGVLINDGAQNVTVAWWRLVFPAAFLVVTLFCFNFIGDGLRDALDPKDR
ncbi:oligopeptide ABC transporter permease OppC [Fluviispira multicolorata]|uniref:Oligopeptide transport system permease protein OppC n=1 Tax=Fluviispira multicolorata TaxID=2654512 RepID=A0A833JDW2_9BACT|nr:oligopeptide ABC transporter permease OppC [Fluviispira multicolorata]KAB8032070.1 oligopeptide ABC transporter permease OppC [Fluviispira multicolorata]